MIDINHTTISNGPWIAQFRQETPRKQKPIAKKRIETGMKQGEVDFNEICDQMWFKFSLARSHFGRSHSFVSSLDRNDRSLKNSQTWVALIWHPAKSRIVQWNRMKLFPDRSLKSSESPMGGDRIKKKSTKTQSILCVCVRLMEWTMAVASVTD